jgi:hypothetical protein
MLSVVLCKNEAMRYIVFLLAAPLLLLSCKKNELDIAEIWHCNNAQQLDSAAIIVKITGSWKWTKQSCFWTSKTTKADKDTKVTFNPNASFTVTENSSIITQGNWGIKRIDNNNWGLNLSSASTYLYGLILFCDNQLLFNDSIIDGCDNLFEKTN